MKERPTKPLSPVKRAILKATDPIRNSIENGYIYDQDGKARDRRNILKENISYNIVATLSGGVFMTGLILYILRNEPTSVQNEYLGLVASLQVLANVSQLFTPLLTAKLSSYKRLVFITRLIYFIVDIIGLGLIPLLPIGAIPQAILFIACIFTMQLCIMIVNPAVCLWHVSNIPDNKRADWMSIQQMALPIINALTSVIASMIMDKFELQGKYMSAVLILRGIFVLLAFWELRQHFQIKEPVYVKSEEKVSLVKIFTAPFKAKQYLPIILIVCLWQGTAFCGQYWNSYIMNHLDFTYTFINTCASMQLVTLPIFMPFWNKVVHKYGWLKTLGLSTLLYIPPYIFNCLMFKTTSFLYVISVFYCYVINPGINLCFANLGYVNLPEKNQTACLSFYNAAAGIVNFCITYCGKLFVQATEGISIPLGNQEILNIQYNNLVAMCFVIATGVTCMIVYKKTKKKTDA